MGMSAHHFVPGSAVPRSGTRESCTVHGVRVERKAGCIAGLAARPHSLCGARSLTTMAHGCGHDLEHWLPSASGNGDSGWRSTRVTTWVTSQFAQAKKLLGVHDSGNDALLGVLLLGFFLGRAALARLALGLLGLPLRRSRWDLYVCR